jgi:hypothetical protein
MDAFEVSHVHEVGSSASMAVTLSTAMTEDNQE